MSLERPHHALEGGDVSVDPVVAVLDLDGLGDVELGPETVRTAARASLTSRAYASASPGSRATEPGSVAALAASAAERQSIASPSEPDAPATARALR